MKIAVIVAVICGFACAVKLLKARLSVRRFRMLLWAAFAVYVAGNLYFTVLSRKPMPEFGFLPWPFHSYVRMFREPMDVVGNELNSWLAKFFLESGFALHGNIMNVLLYVPLGYILPLLFPKLTGRQVVLIGLASTLSTELLQLITKLGWGEFDDLMHNTLGAVSGLKLYQRQFGGGKARRKPDIVE